MSYAEDLGRSARAARRWGLVFVLVVSLAAAGCQPGGGKSGGGGSSEATSPAGSTNTSGTAGSPVGTGSVTKAAQAVLPSVVFVANDQNVQDPTTGRSAQMEVASGSGVVIRQDGYVLTNNHVIAGSDKVTVRIGEESVPATIKGRDPATDLAVIKIDRTGLTAAQIGNPKALVVGEWVIAVGFPFGLDQTVTAGIVSGLGRSTVQPGQNAVAAYTNLIQTDAAINPGNSGGALADLSGRVIGINTLIESSTGQSSGVGFAIPIDFAMSVADQLIKTGKAEHTFMGVSITSANPHGAQGGGQQGAVVASVEKGSPAEKAGIKKGDIITKIGNETITSADDVFTAVRSKKPGDTVKVELKRGNQTVTVDVTLVGRSS